MTLARAGKWCFARSLYQTHKPLVRGASDQLIRAHRHRCDKVRSTDDNARHHGGGIGYDLEPISTP